MNKAIKVIAPAAVALLAVASPARAQSDVYEPQYTIAFERLTEEIDVITGLQHELEGVTDAVRGCELLDQSLAHLQEADRLLGQLIEYSERLRWRRQRESAEERRETVQADIELKQNDINTYCTAQS